MYGVLRVKVEKLLIWSIFQCLCTYSRKYAAHIQVCLRRWDLDSGRSIGYQWQGTRCCRCSLCASPFFKERTQDDKEFKTLRKQIVHSIVEKQKILNQTDSAVAPPSSTIFDEVLRKLTAYTVEAEERHKENGLFGYVAEGSPTQTSRLRSS